MSAERDVVPGRVSIILPVYNRTDWLEEAVRSVLEQTWSDWELILCNDGSGPDVDPVLKKLVELDPSRIQILNLPHRGPGPAREAGRLQASGEFIQYLDSDDRLLPHKFEKQIQALRDQADAGIAYGKTRLIDSEGTTLKDVYKWTGKEIDRLFPGLLVDRWWCTHTPLYRRTLTDEIGAWSSLPYSQDWEYDARAGALNAELVYVPESVSEHRQHSGLRQTGGGSWLSPGDQVEFFSRLLACAGDAGVNRESAEMKHLSRWIFSSSRQAAHHGDEEAAENLLNLLSSTSCPGSFDVTLYRGMTRFLGGRCAAAVLEKCRVVLGRKKSADTLPFSWSEE